MPRIPTAGLNAAMSVVIIPGVTYYIGLFSTDPGSTGASGEFSGGGYVRQPIVFSAVSGGIESDNTAISIPNSGTVTANFFGIFTAATGGTYLGGGAGAATIAAVITIAQGAVSFAAN